MKKSATEDCRSYFTDVGWVDPHYVVRFGHGREFPGTWYYIPMTHGDGSVTAEWQGAVFEVKTKGRLVFSYDARTRKVIGGAAGI